jgi:hypothetical protein
LPLSASGPAGLAAAAQLNHAGHWVSVFERADRIGGTPALRHSGIQNGEVHSRPAAEIMAAEGIAFQTNANVGVNVPVDVLRQTFDSVLLAGGSTQARDLPIPGRDLDGIHFAMDYLPLQNKRCEGDVIPDEQFITARTSASSSSAAAIPAQTVSEQHIVRARNLWFSSSFCQSRRKTAPSITRGRTGPTSSEPHRLTKKAAIVSTRC